jgi:hypothetical protein
VIVVGGGLADTVTINQALRGQGPEIDLISLVP